MQLLSRFDAAVGGSARRHIVLTLAAVLALDSADKAAVGAAAPQLHAGLGVGNTELGALLAVTSLVGATVTVPAGWAVDRVTRTRLLASGVALWAVAMAASSLAVDFTWLLVTRIALGAVTAVAGPAVASLLGDYFPVARRGRIYGYVLAGELAGAGLGFVLAGNVAVLSWRLAFAALAVPAVGVAFLVHRLDEPPRGQQAGSSAEINLNYQQLSLVRAVRDVLRVRSNVVLIASSALGYFFFAGLRGFGMSFVRQHYGLAQTVATTLVPLLGAGALAGVVLGGRLADRVRESGRPAGRILVAGVAALLATMLFVPALATTSTPVALPLLVLAAAGLGVSNPALDAARLDVMPPALWGRAEAVRTLLRGGLEALAPLSFGLTADHLFGGASGLQYTFLVSLVPLLVAAVLMLTVARRTYPGDVARAAAAARTGRSLRFRDEG